jgi:hypothetical protein
MDQLWLLLQECGRIQGVPEFWSPTVENGGVPRAEERSLQVKQMTQAGLNVQQSKKG